MLKKNRIIILKSYAEVRFQLCYHYHECTHLLLNANNLKYNSTSHFEADHAALY
jgi:hypothetical protein